MTLRVAIQRRTVFLTPPKGMDLLWVSRFMESPEVTAMFSLQEPVPPWHFRSLVNTGRCMLGILHRVADARRIGFACMFAPDEEEERDWWEIAAVIEKRQHRDAFSMLHCVDAMSHYMFDHVGVQRCGARVRADNRASDAVVRRLGHTKVAEVFKDGAMQAVYVLTQDDWARRRARLEAGERTHPSGAGAAFVTLPGPPYVPITGDAEV